MAKENKELKKRMSGIEEMVANLIVDQQATLGAKGHLPSGYIVITL